MPERAGRSNAEGATTAAWLSSYTVFDWAWWISWTPFVGMFIARISRGRTIRQFVTGVLLVPSLVSLVWFSIFGGSAMKLQEQGKPIYNNHDGTAADRPEERRGGKECVSTGRSGWSPCQ